MNKFLINAQQLNDDTSNDIVIFDCRFSLADHSLGKQLFIEAHIPGAFHLDMESDLSGQKELHGGRHPLPEPSNFQQTLRQCGVNENTLIVAYDDQRLAGAARLWWLIRYFGHSNIKILDGGFAAWQASGFEVSTEHEKKHSKELNLVAVTPGNFVAKPGSLPVTDQQWVSDHLNDSPVKLIDAREALRYRGEAEPIDLIAGHIPGALNSPWQLVTEENGAIKPEADQQQLWQQLPQAEHYVVYCGSGVTACVNLLSMEIAGISNTCLYNGSWSDWSSYPDNPIAIGNKQSV